MIELLDETKSPDVISIFISSLSKLTSISQDDTSSEDSINDSVVIANASAFGNVTGQNAEIQNHKKRQNTKVGQ